MRKKISLISLFNAVLILVFSACGTPDYLSEKGLSQFILDVDNELIKTVQVRDVQVKVIYRPTDLMVAQELRSVSTITEEVVKKAREKYRGYYYFILSLSKGKKEILSPANQGMEGFSELLNTVSFRMSDKVYMTTTPQDTLFVADYIYNRTFGMGSSTDVLFVFDKAKAANQKFVRFNLEEFGLGIGKQSVEFLVDDLETCPKIFKP